MDIARPTLASLLVLIAASMAGCGNESDPCANFYPADVDPSGTRLAYVVDSIRLPSSSEEASTLGINLDRDENDRPDNALGQLLSTVFSVLDKDIDAPLEEMVADGRILHLLELQSRELRDANGVGARLLLGVDQDADASDNFSGSEPFSVDESEVTEPLRGDIDDGVVRVSLGSVPLQIAIPGVEAPTILRLEAAAIEATVTGDRIDGKIGGVIRAEEVDTVLVGIIHRAAEASIARDCTGSVCEAKSTGAFYSDVFDENDDNQVTLQEVRENALVESLLAPDIDMFDTLGNLSCGGRGVKDSLSVGLGFSAVRAELVQ